MLQLSLFDCPVSAPVVPVVVPAVADLPVPPSDPEARLRWEYGRGEFQFWDVGAEARWRAINPPRPSLPLLPGVGFGMIRPNSRAPGVTAEVFQYEDTLRMGRSYLVGASVPMDQFVKRHRSSLTDWQKAAYTWAVENPLWRLMVDTPGKEWEVSVEGDYVVLALPHQDKGGERHYVTNNGRSKVLVNVD